MIGNSRAHHHFHRVNVELVESAEESASFQLDKYTGICMYDRHDDADRSLVC